MDLADSEEDPLLLYQVTHAGCKRRRRKEAEGGHFRSWSEGCEPSNDDHVTKLPQGNIYYYNSKNIYFEQKLISVPPPPPLIIVVIFDCYNNSTIYENEIKLY
jgi:hypothetical protein